MSSMHSFFFGQHYFERGVVLQIGITKEVLEMITATRYKKGALCEKMEFDL